ncbi:hypothetical protein ACP70R_046317 [Stipagrostis hirtigluma subsp. patula]
MGSAMKCVLFLFSVSFVYLLLNLGILEGALHLASQDGEVSVAVVKHGVSFISLSRFRMLIGLNHHRSRHRRRQKSSPAPAPAPVPTPTLPHETRSAAPAPAPHPQMSHRRMPLKNHSHIVPERSVARKLGGGGQPRLPKATIVALAVVGACLLVLGGVIAAVSLRRSRKLRKACAKPFKLFSHGARAQRSPCATRKVSSHPSPDILCLSSVVQCQENHPVLKASSQSTSISIVSTASKSAEIIVSDYTAKNHILQSDEAESFHSIPCSYSSSGSITELPLQIFNNTNRDPSPSSPNTYNSASGSSYQSLSPDFKFHASPKSQASTASTHLQEHDTSQRLPEKSDAEIIEVNYQETAKTSHTSEFRAYPKAPKEAQVNSKFRNPPPEYSSTSCCNDIAISTTDKTSGVSNPKVSSVSTESSRVSAEGQNFQPPSAVSVPKSPPPPPPPNKPPPSLKGQNFVQPPLPPPLPLQIQVGKDGLPLPRLKPLHWDKVRAAPNRSMVWNDIHSNSFEFEFDEQMIKSLFAYNFQGPVKNEDAKNKTLSTSKHVIEHHKLQNTTILLRTLNASTEQVCSSITEGTGLSVQQLLALVKMKPTKEEEEKLLDYNGDLNMLDPAENFVKALLTIPMAFSRIETMLYKETFDDEVAHIRKSFSMINVACNELRSSKLFLRLLEAVLKTGNRMNVGTIRGGASAFRLDALLKLADIRGADGKTTLLHFVVQAMVRSQRIKVLDKFSEIKSCNATRTEREEYWEMGTEFVSELSNELGNVKKVASIDLDTLKNSISNLSHGLAQLSRLVEKDLTSGDKNRSFLQCMRSFQTYAEDTMHELKVSEAQVSLHVRELTEYYHGEVGKDESNLLHIFVIMRDFLNLLDKVCREMRGSKHNQSQNLVLPLK